MGNVMIDITVVLEVSFFDYFFKILGSGKLKRALIYDPVLQTMQNIS